MTETCAARLNCKVFAFSGHLLSWTANIPKYYEDKLLRMTYFEKFRRHKLFVEEQKRRNFLSVKVSSRKVRDLFVTIFIILFIHYLFYF